MKNICKNPLQNIFQNNRQVDSSMGMISHLKHKGSLIVLAMTATLSTYFLFLTRSSRTFLDVWLLEGIFWETLITILVICFLSYMLFRSLSSVISFLTIQVFLVILIPVLKYPNELNIIGPWDSTAHYSFAKWIIETGHVDTAGNLYYSEQYGYHPGNGILPAILSIISLINLGWSMNIIISVIFLGYILFLIVALKRLRCWRQENVRIDEVLWLIAIFMISIPLSVYYGGSELGYLYAGFILYLFLRQLIKDDDILVRSTILTIIVFLGLLYTHLSTATIIATYLSIAIVTLIIARSLHIELSIKPSFQKATILVTLVLIVFFIYEIFVDAILFGKIVEDAFRHIFSMYMVEIEQASIAMEVRGLSLVDLLLYFISTHIKALLILGATLVHIVASIFKRKALSNDEKKLMVLLVTSYFSWIINWAATGSLIPGRFLALTSFLLSLSMATTYRKLYNSIMIIRKGSISIAFILILIAFVSNFGLPFMPVIKSNGDVYTFPTPSHGAYSNYALSPIVYMSTYARNIPFLCLQPYTAFGLCDLIWHSPKIPRHGFIAPKTTIPDFIIEIMRNYIRKNVVIPQPTRDGILPGPIGYLSLYEKPFGFLIANGKASIYNNGMYILFLS